jgi:hypothetical protein
MICREFTVGIEECGVSDEKKKTGQNFSGFKILKFRKSFRLTASL